jgi:replication factor C subunit 2/4
MLDHCFKSDIEKSYKIMAHLWKLGYSSEDIVTSIFRVCKTHNLPEFVKLEFIKEIGLTHLALVQGTQSLLQLSGMLARLCQVSLTVE